MIKGPGDDEWQGWADVQDLEEEVSEGLRELHQRFSEDLEALAARVYYRHIARFCRHYGLRLVANGLLRFELVETPKLDIEKRAGELRFQLRQASSDLEKMACLGDGAGEFLAMAEQIEAVLIPLGESALSLDISIDPYLRLRCSKEDAWGYSQQARKDRGKNKGGK